MRRIQKEARLRELDGQGRCRICGNFSKKLDDKARCPACGFEELCDNCHTSHYEDDLAPDRDGDLMCVKCREEG